MTVSERPLSAGDNWLCGVFHDKLFPCRLLLEAFTGSAGIKVLCFTFRRTGQMHGRIRCEVLILHEV